MYELNSYLMKCWCGFYFLNCSTTKSFAFCNQLFLKFSFTIFISIFLVKFVLQKAWFETCSTKNTKICTIYDIINLKINNKKDILDIEKFLFLEILILLL